MCAGSGDSLLPPQILGQFRALVSDAISFDPRNWIQPRYELFLGNSRESTLTPFLSVFQDPAQDRTRIPRILRSEIVEQQHNRMRQPVMPFDPIFISALPLEGKGISP
jgi:hypothetical protein